MSEFLHLLHNPAHWAFEGVTDAVFGLVAFLVGRVPVRRWIERHDREKHHG